MILHTVYLGVYVIETLSVSVCVCLQIILHDSSLNFKDMSQNLSPNASCLAKSVSHNLSSCCNISTKTRHNLYTSDQRFHSYLTRDTLRDIAWSAFSCTKAFCWSYVILGYQQRDLLIPKVITRIKLLLILACGQCIGLTYTITGLSNLLPIVRISYSGTKGISPGVPSLRDCPWKFG